MDTPHAGDFIVIATEGCEELFEDEEDRLLRTSVKSSTIEISMPQENTTNSYK